MKIRLSNGELLSKSCKNKTQYHRAFVLYKNGYSPDEALEISAEEQKNKEIRDQNYRIERNKTVQIDIYFNTLCRINDEIKKELDPELKMERVGRMISEALTGMTVVGYTNSLDGGKLW